jgi:hypothetical protein
MTSLLSGAIWDFLARWQTSTDELWRATRPMSTSLLFFKVGRSSHQK